MAAHYRNGGLPPWATATVVVSGIGDGSVAQQLQCKFGHDLPDHSQHPEFRPSSPVQQPIPIWHVRQPPSLQHTINRPILKRDWSNGLYGCDPPHCQQRPPVSPTPVSFTTTSTFALFDHDGFKCVQRHPKRTPYAVWRAFGPRSWHTSPLRHRTGLRLYSERSPTRRGEWFYTSPVLLWCSL